MPILSAPLFQQPPNSYSCGIYSVKMILNYLGVDKSAQELESEIELFNGGTFAPQLCLYLMKLGLKTKIITKNPFLFTAKDRTLSTPELLKRLDYVSTKIKEDDKDNKIAIRFFREYLEAEGQICIEIPHFDHLKTAIEENHLLIANLSGGYIYKDLPSWSFHYVVVNGFDLSSYGKQGSESHEVCYLDPYPNSPSPFPDKISRLAADEFLYAVNSVCHGCVDCGCLIEISKK